MSSNNAITFNNVTYQYAPGLFKKRVYGVRNLSLEIPKGESFGFLGANGAGKTTAIKCLVGLQRPNSGSVLINGTPSSTPLARKQMGFMPEQPYFYEHLTLKELLSFFGVLAGISGASLERQIDSLAEMLSLKDRMSQKIRNLSKGYMQRVNLAQSLIAEPTLLVLDEPFSGLDPIGRREFRDIFLEQKKKGTTLFMSSHILSDIESICDRASILSRSEMRAVVDISELKLSKITSVEVCVSGTNLPEGGTLLPSGLMQYHFASPEEATRFIQRLSSEAVLVSMIPENKKLEDVFIQTINESRAS